MKERINEMLADKINEVFAEMQKEMNIESGDILPMDNLELDDLTDKMAEVIARVISYQK